jgi:hypothetical protein
VETNLKYLRLPNLVGNMIIVSLISHFEYFVKTCLGLFLSEEPRPLKSSESKITFSEIIDLPNKGRIISMMIDKEMNDLFGGNIDQICKYLSNKFNVNLKEIEKHAFKTTGFSMDKEKDRELVEDALIAQVTWADLKEIYNRRNIIVHNDGRVNKKYLTNVGKGNENEYLISDNLYLKKSMVVFMYYGQFIYDKIMAKIK